MPLTLKKFKENWMRIVKNKNCDYKIPEGEMMAWVSYYWTPQWPVIEDCFKDPGCDDGINATGTYSVKVLKASDVVRNAWPRKLPMWKKN